MAATASLHCRGGGLGTTVVVLLLSIAVITMAFRYKSARELFSQFSEFPQSWNVTRVDYSSPELSFPTKCTDCEKAFAPGQRWRGQQTKCFSCEALSADPQYTHPNKVFAAER